MKKFSNLIEMLGFLTSTGDPSFADRIGNALDSISVIEALKDALRTYKSNCVDSEEKCVKVDTDECIPCPTLDNEALDKEVEEFINAVSGKRGGELVEITRALAARIISSSLKFSPTKKS